MKYRHSFKVFELIKTTSTVQFEVILISVSEPIEDRRRPDRVTTGPCMGRLRLIVDLANIDEFQPGRQFDLVIEAKDTESER